MEVVKNWKLRGSKKKSSTKVQYLFNKSVEAPGEPIPMKRDLQSCPSRSMQTLGTNASDGLEYREKRKTTMTPIRPKPREFRTDSTMKF